ncbi:hypothetical protein [Acetobacter sacchari]|uniref:hypothetical protein n=1 Tax=Acetobacter sacchari TaxID=2661687 RepID=UPI001FAFC7C9|nr:hypothetical protein [Acetobacter sacchari]
MDTSSSDRQMVIFGDKRLGDRRLPPSLQTLIGLRSVFPKRTFIVSAGFHLATKEWYGRFLLADALYRAVRSEIASFAVIVDAKGEGAKRFYERESFLPFPDQPMKLFRPMADIEVLFN